MIEEISRANFKNHAEWQREVNIAAENAGNLWKFGSAAAAETELARLWFLFDNEPLKPATADVVLAKIRLQITKWRRRSTN